jgi:hypothetical protein
MNKDGIITVECGFRNIKKRVYCDFPECLRRFNIRTVDNHINCSLLKIDWVTFVLYRKQFIEICRGY